MSIGKVEKTDDGDLCVVTGHQEPSLQQVADAVLLLARSADLSREIQVTVKWPDPLTSHPFDQRAFVGFRYREGGGK